ncbi:uncharacterized protein LOC6566485 [Drosophila grimshawi]|uniref:uncharacterized protein LOC6566485 n=1 Tax=Drosophila grimshawi TaxID=7222 RepID=UPI000C8708EE|nr:uncharacterized protein LOC6566485 [Drosophila grimshawi]
MPRTKIGKRKRLLQRKEAEQEEQLRMAEMKLEATLEKIDELGKNCIQQVNNRMQLILARTHKHVLQMKWSAFLKLQLDHFADYQWIAGRGGSVYGWQPTCSTNFSRSLCQLPKWGC